jgi:hypothetical protein
VKRRSARRGLVPEAGGDGAVRANAIVAEAADGAARQVGCSGCVKYFFKERGEGRLLLFGERAQEWAEGGQPFVQQFRA